MITRRRFLVGAGAAATGGAIAAVVVETSGGEAQPQLAAIALPAATPGLPARQHAWEAFLAHDRHGNPLAPTHDRLLLFDVRGKPTGDYAKLLEAELRKLEHEYKWSHAGLLFTVSWSPDYFEHVLGVKSPIPHARALSDFELPSIDSYAMCLHLASDDDRRLSDVTARLLDGPLQQILRWRETRTGFTGAGIPAAHQNVGGIPHGNPVPASAPLFMGFRSGLKKNQASEDAITLTSGPFTGGTTQHVSYMRLRLDSWYRDLNTRARVARMYAPQVSPAEAAAFTTDAASDPGELQQAIRRYGVIGHAQTSARARRHGRPVILRRDFNTIDGGQAGLHFVSLQQTIEDFIRTRAAMNASGAQLQNPSISDTVNNGINEFIFVQKRANYIVPPRAVRSFPLTPSRDTALAN